MEILEFIFNCSPKSLWINFHHLHIRIRTDHEFIQRRIVTPQIAQTSGHCQKWNLINWRTATHRTLVSDSWTIPNHSRHSRFCNNFAASIINAGLFDITFGFVFARQRHRPPMPVRFIFLIAQHNARITGMTDVDFIAPYERNTGRCTGSARQTGCCLWPFICLVKNRKN